MLPFEVKNIKKPAENKDRKSIRCEQQAIANQLVTGSMPNNPNAQPITQQPARQ